MKRLDWTPKLSIEQSISMTCAWYKNFYKAIKICIHLVLNKLNNSNHYQKDKLWKIFLMQKLSMVKRR